MSATLPSVAGALAACGGGSSSGSSSSSPFAASVRQACTIYYNKAYALPPPIGVSQLNAYPGKRQALREQELAKLQSLTPPTADRAAYTRYLSDMAALDNLYATAIAVVKTPRSFNAQTFTRQVTSLEARLDIEAQELGLAECAKHPYSAAHYSHS